MSNSTDSLTEMPVYLREFMEKINKETIGKRTLVTATNVTEYDIIKTVPIEFAREEMRRLRIAMNKRLFTFRYYSAIAYSCLIFFGVVITAGILGAFSPVVTIAGTLISIIGALGSYVDWKAWEKKNGF